MSKVTRAVGIIVRESSYVLGQFHAARAAYSSIVRARQTIGGRPELKLGERYRPATIPAHAVTLDLNRVDA